jgi:hypothetical protein
MAIFATKFLKNKKIKKSCPGHYENGISSFKKNLIA